MISSLSCSRARIGRFRSVNAGERSPRMDSKLSARRSRNWLTWGREFSSALNMETGCSSWEKGFTRRPVSITRQGRSRLWILPSAADWKLVTSGITARPTWLRRASERRNKGPAPRSLFVAQGGDRVDSRCSACREIAGDPGDGQQECSRYYKSRRIAGADSVEQASHHADTAGGGTESDDQTDGGECQGTAENGPAHITGPGS